MVGWGSRDIVIDVDRDGVPVGIDIDSFASEFVDLTKLEAEGPIFGLARVGVPRDGFVSQHRRPWHERMLELYE